MARLIEAHNMSDESLFEMHYVRMRDVNSHTFIQITVFSLSIYE